ncbi:unnamed protein product [Menidia menidia]|uniref:(Atlantic silverside) hypothetical protein n=1 Tax=Menidia menidia TaxID=238744 RepID=A0A8S4BBW3_9TELE|nr:unnamed protein product [Menidia menidia]
MFLCRSGRLSAAALDQALRSPGSFLVRVEALGRRDVAPAVGGQTFRLRLRFLCASAGRAHLGRPKPDTVRSRDASVGFATTERALLDRGAPLAAGLPRKAQPEGGQRDKIGRHSRRDAAEVVLFTGDRALPSGRCFGTVMQTRASSTQAAAKKGEEGQTDSTKGDVQEASTTSTSEKGPGDAPGPEGEKPSKAQQLKKVFKEYGAVGVCFHIGISLMSLGMFYLLISSGIDMAAILCKVGFSEAVVQSKMAAGTSTFVLAYAIHKLFAPLRISITLVSVPLIVRYLRKTGLFKPPTPTA